MRVYGATGTAPAGAPTPARRPTDGTFKVGEQDSPRGPTSAEQSGHPDLDAVLSEINLRIAVALTKIVNC